MCKECRAEILCVEAKDTVLLPQGKDNNENTQDQCRRALCISLRRRVCAAVSRDRGAPRKPPLISYSDPRSADRFYRFFSAHRNGKSVQHKNVIFFPTIQPKMIFFPIYPISRGNSRAPQYYTTIPLWNVNEKSAIYRIKPQVGCICVLKRNCCKYSAEVCQPKR